MTTAENHPITVQCCYHRSITALSWCVCDSRHTAGESVCLYKGQQDHAWMCVCSRHTLSVSLYSSVCLDC